MTRAHVCERTTHEARKLFIGRLVVRVSEIASHRLNIARAKRAVDLGGTPRRSICQLWRSKTVLTWGEQQA